MSGSILAAMKNTEMLWEYYNRSIMSDKLQLVVANHTEPAKTTS